jgi:hypothetical protein
MVETVIDALELIGAALGIAGLAVVVAALIGGTLGVGVGLVVASVLVFVASVVAARAQDKQEQADAERSRKVGNR